MPKIAYFITGGDDTGIKLALENLDDEVSIILIQNAVYSATKSKTDISEALKQNKTVYASKVDVELRGIKDLLHDGIKLVDYGEIVDLVFGQDTIVNL